MTVFGIAGTGIFKVFGITLPAFRIAGGLILWLVAMDMLRGERTTQESTEEIVEGQEKEDVALTPLAMPMLAGPGAISTVMVLVFAVIAMIFFFTADVAMGYAIEFILTL